MELLLNNGFTILDSEEILMLDGGSILSKSLYLFAGCLATAWTPIVTVGLAVTGVGAPAAAGAALIGSGAATYCFSMASHQ